MLGEEGFCGGRKDPNPVKTVCVFVCALSFSAKADPAKELWLASVGEGLACACRIYVGYCRKCSAQMSHDALDRMMQNNIGRNNVLQTCLVRLWIIPFAVH